MRYVLITLACVLSLCGSDDGAEGLVRFQDHIGRLYRSATWGGANLRALQERLIDLDDAADPCRPLAELPARGRAGGADDGATVADALRAAQADYDLLCLIGGLGSAKYPRGADGGIDTDSGLANEDVRRYLALVNGGDHGAAWRALVERRALDVAGLLDPDSGHRLTWQIGNEIASPSYSFNVNRWLVEQGELARTAVSRRQWERGQIFDPRIIPVYVRYFFAPTAQALEEARRSSGVSFDIALGSIDVFANPRAMPFLEELLAYELNEETVGQFAPALWGTRVVDHVDVVTVHYHLHQQDARQPDAWRQRLDGFKERWIDTGLVRGIWSSEELGAQSAERGIGAAVCLRVVARLLSWVATHGLDKDTAKCFFYADGSGPEGGRGENSLALFWSLIEGRGLRLLAAEISEADERYTFAVDGSERRLLILGQHELRGSRPYAAISSDPLGIAADRRVTAYRIDTAITEVPCHIEAGQVVFDQAQELAGAAVFLLVNDPAE